MDLTPALLERIIEALECATEDHNRLLQETQAFRLQRKYLLRALEAARLIETLRRKAKARQSKQVGQKKG